VPDEQNVAAGERRPDRAVRMIGMIVMALGLVLTIAGVTTYVVVGTTLADEHITVSDDATPASSRRSSPSASPRWSWSLA
jgi:uncharacterized protein YjeT (DUF2065 family)